MEDKTVDLSDYPNIKKIRTITQPFHNDFSADKEVNECLEKGWKLLLVQAGSEHPIFVIGWPQDEAPPLTEYQKQSEEMCSQLLAKKPDY